MNDWQPSILHEQNGGCVSGSDSKEKFKNEFGFGWNEPTASFISSDQCRAVYGNQMFLFLLIGYSFYHGILLQQGRQWTMNLEEERMHTHCTQHTLVNKRGI